MKLIVASEVVFKYAIEYMDTYYEYIPIIEYKLPEFDINECEELIAVQKCSWLPEYVFKSTKKLSIVNIEQLTEPLHEEMIMSEISFAEEKCGYKIKVYDYSPANCYILDKRGIKTQYHPHIPSQRDISFLSSLHIIDKKYDIGFVGALSDRRLNIINKLISAGIKVLIVNTFGPERDIKLASCKFLLNICYSDTYKIFNSLRCNRWLQSGFKVISEFSLDPLYSNNLYLTSYDNLVEYTKHLISTS
jgi:hypothetical protein